MLCLQRSRFVAESTSHKEHAMHSNITLSIKRIHDLLLHVATVRPT
jgi:hypothetical protein